MATTKTTNVPTDAELLAALRTLLTWAQNGMPPATIVPTPVKEEVVVEDEVEEEVEDEVDEDEEGDLLTEEQLRGMTLAELKALAKAENVPLKARMKSDDIIEALMDALAEEPEADEEEEEVEDELDEDEEVEDEDEEEEEGDSYTRDELDGLSLTQLRSVARDSGWTPADYKGMDREALIDSMLAEEEEE